MKQIVIGIGGRSGSGKTTLVKTIAGEFGDDRVTLHTMDNYYRPRHEQTRDDDGYINFDIPTAFYREKFYQDLLNLKAGKTISVTEYSYNNEKEETLLEIHPAPIILVEGLFIYYYDEIRSEIDLKVLLKTDLKEAFHRRLKRDTVERNYHLTEITHRYHRHAEPAYREYIEPYEMQMDLVLYNPDDSPLPVQPLIETIHRSI